jgi:quinol monooxygenase YgiN
MTAHPGEGQALRDLLLEAAAVVAELPGCEVWIVSATPDDADTVWVIEVWRSEADHEASLQDDRVREIIARARPLIAGFGERITMRPLGGKGLGDGVQDRDEG